MISPRCVLCFVFGVRCSMAPTEVGVLQCGVCSAAKLFFDSSQFDLLSTTPAPRRAPPSACDDERIIEPGMIQVASYNIHSCIGADGFYSTDRVAGVIRQGGSDVICLQEVEVNAPQEDGAPMKTRIWSHPHVDDQPSVLAQLAEYEYHAFVPAIRCKASGWKESHESVSVRDASGNFSGGINEPSGVTSRGFGKFGIALLSKYPIVQIHMHWYQRYKRKTLRNVMACLVSLPDKSLMWIVNTHLGCHFIGREQRQQAVELVSFVSALERMDNRRVILCGDFNSPPLFPCVRYMKQSGFRDVWQYAKGFGGTFPSDSRVLGVPCCARKLLRLDYIFVLGFEGRCITCKKVYVQDDGKDCLLASDHLPICVILIFEG